ncbi:MAG: hypothetical protein L0216_11540 [Planctomycetales bacterium]|nr:hypothetical protein [Planctomycetales bacterium]
MSLEVHVLPLATFLEGEFPAPVEKLCHGKGTAFLRVGRRTWARDPADARAAAEAAWRAARPAVAALPEPAGSGFSELLDAEGFARLRAFAARAPGVGGAPHLRAEPEGRALFFPVEIAEPGRFDLLGPGRTFALGSLPRLEAELDRLRAPLGPLKDWGDVGEGETAAEPRDRLYAEKTAWAILRWAAREAARLRLPMIVSPARPGPGP